MHVDEVLVARGGTHGIFKESAAYVQQAKHLMEETPNWGPLDFDKQEALHMIQHKIGRILHGDANFEDHWLDIIGYTQLVLDEIKKK